MFSLLKNFSVPKNAYFIRTRPENHVLSCRYNDKSYLIAFLFTKDALHVCKTVSVSSVIHYEQMEDKETGLGCLSISKKININKLPCYVQPKDFVDVLSMPWINNVGIAYAYDLIEETPYQNVFEAQLVEPSNDLNLFMKKLTDIEDFE
jgi:hypothetical protein